MTNNTCFICLDNKFNEKLFSISDFDSSNLCLKDKFKDCVPEIEWNRDYTVCLNCSKQLENAYDFRHVCIKLNEERLRKWAEIIDVQVEDQGDKITEYEDQDNKTDVPLDVVLEENYNVFTCFHCNKSFTNKTFLARHIKNENKKLKELNCKTCGNKFTNQVVWQNHVNDCHTAKNGVDKISEEGNKDADIKKPTATEITNECDTCGATFNNKYLLKRHKKNVHATEKKYKCDICPSSFVSIVYLNAHKKYHSRDRKYVCLFCGKRYITASDLYHHEKIHSNKRAYKCPECNKAFNTTSDLHKHKICVHLDRNLWKYTCSFCDRKFPLKINLDTHTKTHTGEKNFSCRLCEKKYISHSALKRHMDGHANVKSCTICNMGYRYKKSLDVHMLKSHGIGDGKIPERSKKHFCHICPKSYYANSKLQKHLRGHTGDRPFKCSECEKCFIDKSYIKQHMKTAHGVTEI